MMVSPDFLTQFEAERDALRATNRQLAEANATLTAERDDARRQRDECADALRSAHAVASDYATADRTVGETNWRALRDRLRAAIESGRLSLHPATNDDARAILHALASQPARPPVAVVVERARPTELTHLLTVRCDRETMTVTTDEAAALVTALLADGAVHNAWLHGRGGR